MFESVTVSGLSDDVAVPALLMDLSDTDVASSAIGRTTDHV
jgi:hypothetical protein